VSRVSRLFELLDKAETPEKRGFHIIKVECPLVYDEAAPMSDADRVAAIKTARDAAIAKARADYERERGPIGDGDIVFMMIFSWPDAPKRERPESSVSCPPDILSECTEAWTPSVAREQEHNWPVPRDGIRTAGEWSEPLKYGPSPFPEADVVHDPRRFKPISYADGVDNE